ncbi:winged helix-turn-helix domain-containing tetratricopeptide repeat protein [Hyphomicrobium sp.]|uniref:winged helix-turn-helix domain-containing tetratricopeptide repeat protein n=1 Tax=Hyphomicrobium sp. TaxID=82 RepID=UPI002BF4A1B9|nr:winged helix-turn-helix domain-containing protein [Hyphomicrobium sp.]HVZ03318.1 winged helix-turn-helix domain-containing protein [Hyphomicrobium sp.]
MQFLFADCVLDRERRELTRASETVTVGPQVFDLLLYLIQNRDRVVSKDDIFDAVWGGRVVSESTLTSHINAVRKVVGDNGNEQHLVRTVPRKGFRFVGAVKEAHVRDDSANAISGYPAAGPSRAVNGTNKPSIAVLPFQNLSGDPEQAYFADGVVEEIITALSRVRWLFVIARNSSFRYRDRPVDIKQVSEELGVGYLLEGSVRKAGDRIRITGQLIEAGGAAHLWAERFEGKLDDIFELQDHIAASVAGAIAPQVELAEIERAKSKPTASLNAYDCYLRGLAHMHRGTKESVQEALPLFHRSTELDPEFAAAQAMTAWCYFWRRVNGWSTDIAKETTEAAQLARRAVELGRDDAVALTRGGHALAHLTGDLDSGIALLDRAVFLNPNLASAWFLSGFLRTWHGEPDSAIEHFKHAMRLSPVDPELYRMQAGTAMAHLFAGRIDAASVWAEQAYTNLPTFLMVVALVAATRALSGRTDEARQAMHQLRQLDPTLRISNLTDWLPIHRPEHLALFAEGLRNAGLPES